MTISAHVLFGRPQREIASLLRGKIKAAASVCIVSGFATIEGVEAIFPLIRANVAKLACLVVGAATYRAFEAFDRLIDAGVPMTRLFVHLGHTRATSGNAKYAFVRYPPMLQSKIYYMDMGDGSAAAFIGSHNLTGFALHGLNGEAAVLLDGPIDSTEMLVVRTHIDEVAAQAVNYSPGMKEAYAWWAAQFFESLQKKVDDAPRDGDAARTIVLLSAKAKAPYPKAGDIIYFEIPELLAQINSMSTDVHLYIFPAGPASPYAGLNDIDSASKALWCRIIGIEREEGGVELKADWHIAGRRDPRLLKAAVPFRPVTAAGMRQVRAKVRADSKERFDYLFSPAKPDWAPVFDDGEGATIRVPKEEEARFSALEISPPEDLDWQLVRGLTPRQAEGDEAKRGALVEYSPEGDGFILSFDASTQARATRLILSVLEG